ncbi:MAG: 2-oxo acid dehydrogenase subunit E2 [Calditrichaceae bacterium]|nr:2-oxo acid dehydrogenase subunit E2 [Calditrichaceae bacterium]MBN2709695.1 2-oxo acid dehydrogenase subunit E2 [Calditrichaceae bacterium]RQV94478.1 MAG: dehydrogenase [Calditrichota bacterium]
MNEPYKYQKIPQSRIATFDVYAVGLSRHHVSALLEADVTESRIKLRALKRNGNKISFNAWLVRVIGKALEQHPEAAGFLYSTKKLIVFRDINISMMVEKEISGKKVPIPLVIEKANKKGTVEITREIENAKSRPLSAGDIVLEKQTKLYERLYYHLPGLLRRAAWRWMLKHPKFVYKKMGNVLVTSLGMIGRINGWFITRSIHPVSFGIGSIIKKPVVIDDEIKVREILNMTVLLDHDVIDGGPMVRLVNDLVQYIENGYEL